MTYSILQMWFKLMILVMIVNLEIYFVFHLTAAQKYGFLTQDFINTHVHQKWFITFRSNNFEFVYLDGDKICAITRMRKLNDVKDISEFRKNLISLYIVLENSFSYKSNGDMDIVKASKGALTVMRTKKIACNIYKQLKSTFMDDVVKVEYDNHASKLWHMCLGHLSEQEMTKFNERNLLKGVHNCQLNLCKYYVLETQCHVRFKFKIIQLRES